MAKTEAVLESGDATPVMKRLTKSCNGWTPPGRRLLLVERRGRGFGRRLVMGGCVSCVRPHYAVALSCVTHYSYSLARYFGGTCSPVCIEKAASSAAAESAYAARRARHARGRAAQGEARRRDPVRQRLAAGDGRVVRHPARPHGQSAPLGSAPTPPQGALGSMGRPNPLPRLLELAVSKAVHLTAFAHPGAASRRPTARRTSAIAKTRRRL